jgi:hypothetical protein
LLLQVTCERRGVLYRPLTGGSHSEYRRHCRHL